MLNTLMKLNTISQLCFFYSLLHFRVAVVILDRASSLLQIYLKELNRLKRLWGKISLC